MDELNDIKVLFKRHSDSVIIDTTPEGQVVLFNHNDIVRCPIGIFTGVYIEVQKGINPVIEGMDGGITDKLLWENMWALRMADNENYGEPTALITFVPKAKTEYKFRGHLIELGGRR